ncbi:Copper transporter [Rhynchospora pubera]|uniref:Copper transport protein n=1 Tax=Rhynchospora pubera TaxID=906938 RepID=A0AAV8FG01_9POAL|nr:Copper transporter [Rhynchospora pubera]
MDMNMNMNMTMNGSLPAPAMKMSSSMKYMHMTLFWGKNSIILFKDFPGSNTGHYILALIIVFACAAGVEFLSQCRLIGPRWQRMAAGLARTVMHTVRVGLYYMLMLALMSFNVGVLLVSILGHAIVFLGFAKGWTSVVASPSD